MVALSRAAGGADRLRPLRRPRPLGIEVSAQGMPAAVRTAAGWVEVVAVLDHWRLDDEWWRERPEQRWYYRLALAGGRTLTVFHDRASGAWLAQEYGRAG